MENADNVENKETSTDTYKIELDRESLKQYTMTLLVLLIFWIAICFAFACMSIEFARLFSSESGFFSVIFWLGLTGTFAVIFVLGIFFAYYKLFGEWLIMRQVEEKDYFVKGDTLCINQGVFFLSRKTIPLNRITDVVLIQGPLMRFFGFWRLNIQTASVGMPTPEAVLWAINDPEKVRDEILKRRNIKD
ncbi:MAG: PH domain-containing protein [Thermoguttaceae bacterium]